MRNWAVPMLLAATLGTGCAHRAVERAEPGPRVTASQSRHRHGNQRIIVTPENALIGRVATVNAADKFVVLNFAPGHMPPTDQRLQVYRQGLKVGELKVTGPVRDENVVADIIDGEAEAGDEVRDR